MKTVDQQLDDLLRRLRNASADDMTVADIEALFAEAAVAITTLRLLALVDEVRELVGMDQAGRA